MRNAQVNSMLGKLVDKLGVTEAPQVAAFYLTLNSAFFVGRRHPVNLLLLEAEGIRTQWATGVKATHGESKNAAVKDEVVEQVKRVEALMARRPA